MDVIISLCAELQLSYSESKTPGMELPICEDTHAWSLALEWYFWFQYDLGQKYYAPEVFSDRGSNSQPPDHDGTFHSKLSILACPMDGQLREVYFINLALRDHGFEL